ncbi:MAG: XdhC family protein [Chloroherpetonaceae bacterium]|nr:XdhC family protein [Chloroherpetonaceae bacterium]MCS7211176.1 XdhC family protein [Chloroherpetonaceae bacterium]MDW8020325.1 XdhC family protein [Chloroherpetonaceae bacterium]MDW8466475.1 XdhC family protein [Chloroherpetonaceae bacterium]
MKELSDILCAAQAASDSGERFALATLVKVQGSSYRRAGAKMLITESGKSVGAISGGCLEGDVRQKALFAIQTQRSLLVAYDSMDEDASLGYGLGCHGKIFVLIESSELATLQARLQQYQDFLRAPKPTGLATVYGAEGSLQREVGRFLSLRENDAPFSNISSHHLRLMLAHDVAKHLHRQLAASQRYECSDGAAEVFIDVLLPPVHFLIIGAGYDAVPLAELAKRLGWQVSVVDRRPSYLSREGFGIADARRLLKVGADIASVVSNPARTAAVVMTHNFELDVEFLFQLLPMHLAYLGVLGPKRRTEKLLAAIRARGLVPTETMLNKLYAPVGLDIGAELPEEIALSILAEIRAVLSGRTGSFLRNRPTPIHSESVHL